MVRGRQRKTATTAMSFLTFRKTADHVAARGQAKGVARLSGGLLGIHSQLYRSVQKKIC